MSDPVTLNSLADLVQQTVDEMSVMRADMRANLQKQRDIRDDLATLATMIIRLENSLARKACDLHMRLDALESRFDVLQNGDRQLSIPPWDEDLPPPSDPAIETALKTLQQDENTNVKLEKLP